MQSLEETTITQDLIGEQQQAPRAADPPQPIGLRVLRAVLLGLFTQYVVIALIVGLSLAATLHYYVTPYVVANFEAIARALKPM